MADDAARPSSPGPAPRVAGGRLRAAVTPESPFYKWWVAATIMLCVFMVLMNISTVSLALPSVMTTLSMSLDQAQWVVTAYMIASAVVIPTVGWLGNALGNRNLLLVSLALFVTGSILCGLAWSGPALIAFRIVQGIGGGPVLPMAMTFVTQAFPPQQRGLAVGLYGLGASFAPVIGPVAGGYLTEYVHWRMIFFVNLLPGLMGALLVLAVLPHTREKLRRRLDTPGLVALAAFLVSLLLALSLGRRYGWDSAFIQRCLAVAGVSLVTLVAVELGRKQPLIDLRLLANPAFSAALMAVVVIFMAFYSNIFLQAYMLQRLFDYTPAQAGRLILPGALALAAVMVAAGRLTDAVDRRLVILSGLGLFALSCHASSWVTLDRPADWLVWTIMARYVALGLTYAPIVGATLSALPPEQVRMGSGLVSLVQSGLAPALGLAAMTTVLQQRTTYYSGILGQEQVASSLPWFDVVTPLRGLLHSAGETLATLTNGSMVMLQHHLVQQASLAAYQDYFLLMSLCIVIVPLIVALRPRPQPQPARDNRYDVVVIGSGAAGTQAALQACELGARVALLERRETLGGVDLLPGVVAGNVLRDAAATVQGVRRRPFFDAPTGGRKDIVLKDLLARAQKVAHQQAALLEQRLQLHAGRLDVFRGYHATVESPKSVHAWLLNNPFESLTLAAESIILATGSTPRRPPQLTVDNRTVFDTDSAFTFEPPCDALPESVIVDGADAAGVEQASTFAALGARVWVVHGDNEFLPFVDRGITAELSRHLEADGVELIHGVEYERGAPGGQMGQAQLVLADGRTLEADVLIVACGREGSSHVLGLDDVGVTVTEDGWVQVNELFQASVPGIFAAGSVTGLSGSDAASGEQGRLAATYALGRRPGSAKMLSPVSVRTIPEIAGLGPTQQALEAMGAQYAQGTARYEELFKAPVAAEQGGMLSLLFEPVGGHLLGVHIFGQQASELIQIGQAVMRFNGTIEYFLDAAFDDSTLGYAYRVAALDGLRRVQGHQV